MSKDFWNARHCSLIILLSISLILIGCSQTGPAVNTHSASTGPVITWIRQNAIPLKTVEPGSSDADLEPLARIVGNASMVGLGEETHGTHEFFAMKSRIAEFLIAHLGFTTFVMENNWGMSRLVDAYINGGQIPLENVMQQGLFGSWQTQEYRNMLEWMRAYNADPTHATKLHFMGMDIQGVSQGDFNAVENYVDMVDRPQAAPIQTLYAGIVANGVPLPSGYVGYYSLPASTKQRYNDQAQQVSDLLKANQQVYEKRSSPHAFALALQNARIIVQFTTYLNANTSSESLARFIQRDAFMAENVAWIHNHAAGNQQKMIVWAHDGHIANNTSYFAGFAPAGTDNLGGFLRKWYKQSYLPIATSLYQGTYTIYLHAYQTVTTATLGVPGKDTYNYTLGNVGIPLYLLDLRQMPPGPVTDWANGPRVFLLYGLGGEDLSISGPLKYWFDVIILMRSTTASHSLL
jgi:erythromycin esterase